MLTLSLCTAGYAQTLDTAKLDQLLDRLAEKNKGIGRLTLAKDNRVIWRRKSAWNHRHSGMQHSGSVGSR